MHKRSPANPFLGPTGDLFYSILQRAQSSTQIAEDFFACQIAAGKGPGEVVDTLDLLAALVDIAVADGVTGAVKTLHRLAVAENAYILVCIQTAEHAVGGHMAANGEEGSLTDGL